MSADAELLAALEMLLERERENRRTFIEDCTLPDANGDPDLATLDAVEEECVADYDRAIGQAEAAIAKAKAAKP